MIRKLWPGLLLNLGAAAFGFAMLHRLPTRVASHWGIHGEVNGWTSRAMLVLLTPALALVMALVLSIAPRLDPKRRNFLLHADAYWIVTNAILGFLAALHVVIIGYNLGWSFNIAMVIGLGLGALFMLIGNLLSRVRPNWIFGIRTPWTLSSDRAWRETHRVGGYGFVLVGLSVLLAALLHPGAVYFVMGAGVAVVALFSVVWSYFAWKRDPNALGRET
ncbi:MAG: SdpI family protein [Gemmatimonadales bacterium]